ncbi:MAG TPA: LytTR family DNA-binding domain-containing protein [Ferruginibacter sp.]|nr:LytTR family DNA-binding domain-containing protein [Ferruginibacter sp.]HRE64008.1 LytTR family DNA-binding domain-containing protein [Ferruginibacter sp.]
MLKALIIDDEPAAVKTLELMIKRYVPEIEDLKSTNDPAEGIHLLKTYQPQILFLDIQMPVMTGFDILKHFPNLPFNIIFTTAHDEYAIQAIRFSALDFLLKPIDADELQTAVEKYMIKEVLQLSNQALYNNFLHNITSENKDDFKLALSTTEGTYFYKPEQIVRLEGESNYTRFFFTEKKPILASKTLREFEDILATHGFLRIHKSHLINKKHITKLSGNGVLTMSDKSMVEISRRKKAEIAEYLKAI